MSNAQIIHSNETIVTVKQVGKRVAKQLVALGWNDKGNGTLTNPAKYTAPDCSDLSLGSLLGKNVKGIK